jgi:peptidoglycan/xylan/chitin deacetylase (PgdA/CDA1 family)
MTLSVLMYHYIRGGHDSGPRLNAMALDDFRRQIEQLAAGWEIATIESATAFLSGEYVPRRPLCLLTFDDALREHYEEATPILVERGVSGIFFVQTSGPCGHVAAVHQSHLLMAHLGFERYRALFLARLARFSPETALDVDDVKVRRRYRWDTLDVARFKYLSNFIVGQSLRERILSELFGEHFGDEAAFAREFYFSWREAREMQRAGMLLGGHSHRHASLPALRREEKETDLHRCAELLFRNVDPQAVWPFSYPYGETDEDTAGLLGRFGFGPAFTTEFQTNEPGVDLLRIRRVDPKDVEVTAACTS